MGDRLRGRVAIVSGGATGVGGAAARLFAAEGARVAVLDINPSAAQHTVQAVLDAGGQAFAVTVDVSQAAQVSQAVAQVVQRFGTVDVLFNHAGSIVVKPRAACSRIAAARGAGEWPNMAPVSPRQKSTYS